MDYYDIGQNIAGSMRRAGVSINADQVTLMTAALSVYLLQRDRRIEQLERALKSCLLVLNTNRSVAERFTGLATQAIDEANKALMER